MRRSLRYVCQCGDCEESFVTSRGFKVHADRDHHGYTHPNRPQAKQEWVEVE